MIVTCPRCFSFDDVRPPRRFPDGRIEYTCTADHDGAGQHVWSVAAAVAEAPVAPPSAATRRSGVRVSEARTSTPRAPRTPRVNPEDGAVEELVAPMLACVKPGEPFVEYGVVEYRFREQWPELFVAHVRERGHLMLGARRGQASASTARFGKALSRLASLGELEMVKGPGTGAWRHDQSITYWARPPRPSGPLLTWSMFCAATGRSQEWTDEDRSPFA
jgi:hypothetical protein